MEIGFNVLGQFQGETGPGAGSFQQQQIVPGNGEGMILPFQVYFQHLNLGR